jgi:hypothetical protein
MTGTITVKAPSTPSAVTNEQTGVTQTAATLNGSVSPEGEATEYEFEYGTATVSEHKTTPASVGAADFTSHAVSLTLTNLSPGTPYHFEVVAIYGVSKTRVLGGERTFTTHPLEKPTVTTGGTSARGETEATLHGTVNPGGEATEYWFEYGTTNTYGSKTEKKPLPASGSDQSVEATLTKLAPGTEYHYRLVAENLQGIREGTDSTVTTISPPAKEPTKEPPAKEPTPSPTPTPTPGPISPEPEIAPLVGPLVEGSLKLTAPRHGSSVRGSVQVSKAGVGGRLEVDLLAKSASLARRGHSKPVTVGRFVRSSVSAGKVSFSVSLNAKAKRALSRHRRLALTVRIVLTPTKGAAVTVTKSVVLHA